MQQRSESPLLVKPWRVFLCAIATLLMLGFSPAGWPFVTFESGQVRPLAFSQDGNRLYAVNTPDGRLEIFDVKNDGLSHVASVPVGLEPVAVAVRANGEVWVVNHLSDSVSIVDATAATPGVVQTILVGDEPNDIVFAGQGQQRAFISAAHRGQNSPYMDPANPGELTTPGIGRADIWVYEVNSPTSPLAIVTLFTDSPRALAVSPDGATVYAAGFLTGNKTAAIPESSVCNGNVAAPPCQPGAAGLTAPGGLPAPNVNVENVAQPEVGLIVKHNGQHWVDELNRVWDDMVRFNLPDDDVFAISADTNPPAQFRVYRGVGTTLFNMAVNPKSGKVYVANTDAANQVRFEGSRPTGSTTSTVQGKLHLAQITVLDGTTVIPVQLNKHIDYSIRPAPAGVKEKSLAIPLGMAVSGDGKTLYLAAFGSSKIGIFDTAALEGNTFVPNTTDRIAVSGGGPSGMVLDEARHRLYVMTRFDNSIAIVDTLSRSESSKYPLHNPEPPSVVNGRPFLYDAGLTSSNGEASCASCHIFADFDALAWDLGDPENVVLSNPNPDGPIGDGNTPYHPIKGPMTTQSMRGLANHGPMHWRGDRTAGRNGGDPLDEVGAFKEFNVAFGGLVGRAGPLTDAQMQAFADFALQIVYPPNPIRQLDNSLTPSQQAGHDFYFNQISDVISTCNGCHLLDPANGAFGSSGLMSFDGETQGFKIPQLRNAYQKVGMFGMPPGDSSLFVSGDATFWGDQIKGFGFTHDGSVDTLLRFFNTPAFSFPGGDAQRRDLEQFVFAFDSNLAPIVGQQVTFDGRSTASTTSRLALLLARAGAGEADIVVKGRVAGAARGWVRQSDGTFKSDKAAESPLSEAELRALANSAGRQLTYTATPVGEGVRTGIDQDEDGVLDGDDNCRTTANPAQQDSDSDGVGDVCDNCTLVANSTQRDTNGDGYGNWCDADLDNNGSTNTLDLQIYKAAHRSRLGDANYNPDADFNGDDRVNTLDLGIYKGLHRKAPGPACCGV